MACKETYLGIDGQPSILYQQLTDRFGKAQGEVMYLNTKLYDWDSSALNHQGEPDYNTLILGTKGIVRPQKRTTRDIVENLDKSTSKVKFLNEIDGKPVHVYEVAGKIYESVSRWIDKIVPYTGSVTDYNYSEEGTRGHAIFEQVVLGRSTKEIIDSFKLTDPEKKMLRDVRSLVSKLKKRGTLIPEYRIVDTDKGVAGTIDLILIRDDGKVEIYDVKTVYQTPGTNKNGPPVKLWDPYKKSGYITDYKAKRYGTQVTMYKKLLEKSDKGTGRIGLEVDGIYVIPIEYWGAEGDWNDIKVGSPDNIETWSRGNTNYATWAEKEVDALLNATTPKAINFKGHKSAVDADSFVEAIIPDETIDDKKAEYIANQIYTAHRDKNSFTYKGMKYEWTADAKNTRISQIKNVIQSANKEPDFHLARSAVATINGDPQGIFDKDDEANNQLQQLVKVFGDSQAFLLSDIKGFEKYKDVIVLQRPNGTAELVKLTMDNINRIIDTKNKPLARRVKKALGYDDGVASLASNIMSNIEAQDKGIKLRASVSDKERLRLALIAMEVRAANPELNIDRILVQSYSKQNKTTAPPVMMYEILPQIKTLYSQETVKEKVGGRTKQVLDNPESYLPENFDYDPVIDLLGYYEHNLSSDDFINPNTGRHNARWFMLEKLKKYDDGSLNRDELIKELVGDEGRIRAILRNKYAGHSQEEIQNLIESDPEYLLFTKVLMQLQNLQLYPEKDISAQILGNVNKFLLSPTRTGKQTLDQAFNYSRQVIDKVKQRLTEFNKHKRPIFEKLRDASGLAHMTKGGIGVDNVVAMGTAIYESLIQTKKDGNGKEYFIPMFKKKGTPEYNALSTAQKNAIEFMNNEFKKAWREAHPEVNKDGTYKVPAWPDYAIPVITSKPGDYLYKAKRKITEMDASGAARMARKGIARTWNLATGQYDFANVEDANRKYKLNDYFRDQVDMVNGTLSFNALNAMGLDENFNLIDPDMNEKFQLDLDGTVTSFVEHYSKKIEYDKALPMINLYRTIFKLYEMAYFLPQKDSVKWLDAWVDDNMLGRKIKGDESVSKIVSFATGAASTMMLGLNLKVITANSIQNSMSTISRAAMATMKGDKRFPGVRDFTKASAIFMKALNPNSNMARKIDLVMDAYLPEDLIKLKSKRHKPAVNGVINGQTMFSVDMIIERAQRAYYLVAQMIKDGTWDAHHVMQKKNEYGETIDYLQYNEHEDARFRDNKEFRNFMRTQMAKEEQLDKDGRMKMAYDWNLRSKYRAWSELMIPSADKDNASWYRHFGMAGGISMFRNWFRDSYIQGTKREYMSHASGDYFKTKDGYTWSLQPYKGFINSLLDLPNNMVRLTRDKNMKNWSEQDKENYVLMSNALIMAALLAGLGNLIIPEEEKDKEENKFLAYLLDRAIQDSVITISFAPLLGIFDDPFIFLSYYKRLFNKTMDAMGDAGRGDFDSSWETIQSEIPLVREF